jgi:hypothetical protein
MLNAQPMVDKHDIAFKWFVPLALSSEVKQECSEKTGIRIKGPWPDHHFFDGKPDGSKAAVLPMSADP